MLDSPSPQTPVTLQVTGELDLGTTSVLLERARSVLAETNGPVMIDLSEVTFIDAAGIGALIRVKRAAATLAVPLRMVAPTRVRHVLDLVGMTQDLAAAA